MGALNTFFNGQTAKNTAATAWRVGQVADAGRRWELQQRGWITPASTPAEIEAVEAILAAQMRARIELQSGHKGWTHLNVAVVGGAVALVVVLSLAIAAKRGIAAPGLVLLVLVLALLAASVGVAAVVVRRREAWRNQVLARAVVHNGVCGWCGRPAPHILEGQWTEPRVYHAIDIERAISRGPR